MDMTVLRHSVRGGRGGSALVLTIVLITLLAVVGVAFLLMARVDNVASSALSENRELNLAVDTVVAEICEQLVSDVPGIDPNRNIEYEDYPGLQDEWLASNEPYDPNDGIMGTAPAYLWEQISDVTGYLKRRRQAANNKGWSTRNVRIKESAALADPDAGIIADQKPVIVADGNLLEQMADADGDGVADSKWIELEGQESSRGKPIYAAIRVIDNCGMLNVNTGLEFPRNPTDPNLAPGDIDGSSLLQVNLMAMSWRPGVWNYNPQRRNELLLARADGDSVLANNFGLYEQDVIWNYSRPRAGYTPFDISDELELRYRYVINHEDIDARIETFDPQLMWAFRTPKDKRRPVATASDLDEWFQSAFATEVNDPNIDVDYAYRHLSTTYSYDRTINPLGLAFNGGRMAGLNTADVNELYLVLNEVLRRNRAVDPNGKAAQLAVNIIDYRDSDADPTLWTPAPGPNAVTYYGFEPQPFISEIGFLIDGGDPSVSTDNSFAVELYNPFDIPIGLTNYRLELRKQDGTPAGPVNFTGGVVPAGGHFVITNRQDAMADLNVSGALPYRRVNAALVLATYTLDPNTPANQPPDYIAENYDIELKRTIGPTGDLYLDRQETENTWFDWDQIRGTAQYYARADDNWNVVYQDVNSTPASTLGQDNGPGGSKHNYNLATGGKFRTVGQIGRVLTIAPSPDPNDMIGLQFAAATGEADIRLDIESPGFTNLFQYLTVFDPARDGLDNDADGITDPNDSYVVSRGYRAELKVPGRINVNTAPPFVIAQLPWMSMQLSRDIVRTRNIVGGYRSLSELMQVQIPLPGRGMDWLGRDNADLAGYPDLTPNDGAVDDFEERDILLSRISNLATVRSDVFTAYILVRIGETGPQKRVIAILDRSNVYRPQDQVKVVAISPVPDPR